MSAITRFDSTQVPVLPTHSHAVRVENTVYVAGQVGIPLGDKGIPEDFAVEVETALDHLEAALQIAGSCCADVIRTTCYLSDITLMDHFNEIYLRRFGGIRPARTTIQAQLAHGLRFEIDAIALVR